MSKPKTIVNFYSKTEIKQLLEDNFISKSNALYAHLIKVFSILPKKLVAMCVERIDFLEMDRWGETYAINNSQRKTQRVIIRISQETLDLTSEISKFIFLHEIGHFIKEHCAPMSNQEEREKQDKDADGFASLYFPDWKRYFIRDKDNTLKLTKLGKHQRIRKIN